MPIQTEILHLLDVVKLTLSGMMLSRLRKMDLGVSAGRFTVNMNVVDRDDAIEHRTKGVATGSGLLVPLEY